MAATMAAQMDEWLAVSTAASRDEDSAARWGERQAAWMVEWSVGEKEGTRETQQAVSMAAWSGGHWAAQMVAWMAVSTAASMDADWAALWGVLLAADSAER